jgi:1-deoxy-D-xylulose-5-phosphate reductoisomerase
MPAVLNAANEKAVSLFLKKKIPYTAIPLLIRRALDSHKPSPVKDLEDILEVDRRVRQQMGAEYKNL